LAAEYIVPTLSVFVMSTRSCRIAEMSSTIKTLILEKSMYMFGCYPRFLMIIRKRGA